MSIAWKNETTAVIGGSGFLGRYLLEALQERGCSRLISLSRHRDPALEAMGVTLVQGDLRNPESVENACRKATIVFHTAAKAGVWGSYREYYDINVGGTATVLAACRRFGITRLVYTSSPSVAYSPTRDIAGDDESLPYPPKFLAAYPATKALAEKLVLRDSDKELRAVALRPHLIWGPRDPHLLPRLLEAAARGRLPRIGDGHNLVDLTYAANAAAAHCQAAEMLTDAPAGFRGVYFISDGSPVNLWNWLNELFLALGLPATSRAIGYAPARRVGAVMETLWKLLPLPGEPLMTRFVAGQLAFSHYFNIAAARRDFGYAPVVPPEQALAETIAWLRRDILPGVKKS